MVKRELIWEVDGDGAVIRPIAPQYGGVQGEHNITRAIFVVAEDTVWTDPANAVYIECEDNAGNIDTTEQLSVADGKVSYLLPRAWTQYGGTTTLRLVAEGPGVNGVMAYTPKAPIYFDSRQNAMHKVDGLLKGRLAEAERRMKEAVEEAEKIGKRLSDRLDELEKIGVGLNATQVDAIYNLLKIAAYTENANAAHAKFLSAFDSILNGGGSVPGCPHKYVGVETLAPTCTVEGVRTHTCSLCGDSYTEAIPATGHTYVDGECSVCGEKDPDHIVNLFDKDTMCIDGKFINGVGIIRAQAGCKLAKIPVEPNTTYAFQFGGTDFSPIGSIAMYSTDDTLICKTNNRDLEFTDANTVYVTDLNNDSSGKGYTFTTTSDCAYIYFTAHLNETSTVIDKAMLEIGTVCHDYVHYVGGGGGGEEPSDPECPHSYVGVVTLAPTCTVAGVRTYTCSLCGHSYTEVIPATGHTYVDGECSVCGAEDPSHTEEPDNPTEPTTVNLFDKNTMCVDGKYINGAGKIQSYAGSKLALIPVEPNKTYAIQFEEHFPGAKIGSIAMLASSDATTAICRAPNDAHGFLPYGTNVVADKVAELTYDSNEYIATFTTVEGCYFICFTAHLNDTQSVIDAVTMWEVSV